MGVKGRGKRGGGVGGVLEGPCSYTLPGPPGAWLNLSGAIK